MSSEIKFTSSIDYANGALSDRVATNTLNLNQNTVGMLAHVVNVANTATNIDLSQVNTLGYAVIQHITNSNNFIQIGVLNTGANVLFGRLYYTEKAILRLEPGKTYQWQSNTNAVKALIKVYND